jgi:hypothetical protein
LPAASSAAASIQFGLARVCLGLAGGQIFGGLVQLGLRGERVDGFPDVRKGLKLGQGSGHRVLAGLAELGVIRLEDHPGRAAG